MYIMPAHSKLTVITLFSAMVVSQEEKDKEDQKQVKSTLTCSMKLRQSLWAFRDKPPTGLPSKHNHTISTHLRFQQSTPDLSWKNLTNKLILCMIAWTKYEQWWKNYLWVPLIIFYVLTCVCTCNVSMNIGTWTHKICWIFWLLPLF